MDKLFTITWVDVLGAAVVVGLLAFNAVDWMVS
jgi:hypothetical protein